MSLQFPFTGHKSPSKDADAVDRHDGVDYGHLIPVICSGLLDSKRVKWLYCVTLTKSHSDYTKNREGLTKTYPSL